ncbi:hypothetical protein L1987_45620 [Smallanthus sonchifolius]|uniref:Uncharacterized protein n=1 Tax=Smallanthus sonchifolius TaxID=185202 RepID=A0ACB9FXJ3_9ASTR|nr:hypothetical protein L1987_45620 [Smallanthus sonchifolius]
MRRSRTITEEARSDNRTPSVDDQIRDYRFSSRIRHRAAAIVARRRGQRTLESQLDPEAQLRISQTRRARMVAVNEHDTEEINDEDEFVGMAFINERYFEHGVRLLMQQEAAKRRPTEQIWDTLGQPSGN